MAGKLQPLAKQFPIVNDDGTPTEYFIRWAQERQIDITNGITEQEAQDLINEWAADRAILTGIGLAGGGDLSQNRTIYLDAVLDDLNDVDLSTPPTDQQVLVYDESASKWVPADQSGGGGGGSSKIYAPLVNGDLPGPVLMANDRGECIMVEVQ